MDAGGVERQNIEAHELGGLSEVSYEIQIDIDGFERQNIEVHGAELGGLSDLEDFGVFYRRQINTAGFVINFLVQRLSQLLEEKANFFGVVKAEVESICIELRCRLWNESYETLEYTEEKPHNSEIENTFRKIRDFAYEAEDVIDTIILNIANQRKRKKKMMNIDTHTEMLRDLAKKIKDLYKERGEASAVMQRRKRGEEILKIFEIEETYALESDEECRFERGEASAVMQSRTREVEVYDLVGLRILEDLLIQGNPVLDVISVIGKGGSGKTTLAREIYNEVKRHFECCAWVYASRNFRVRKLLLEILSSEMPQSVELTRELEEMREGELKRKLFEYLHGKKYLVVMDDIWNTEVLKEVRSVFPDNFNGSRILITSSHEEVARHASCTYTYNLSLLKEHDSWQLFCEKVFQGKLFQGRCPSDLETRGRQIAKICGGSPLSLVVLGGLLAKKKKTLRTWEILFGNANWYPLNKDILTFSYTQLPPRLKPCFLYFGAYPENFEIPVKQLIRLWVAEGFMGLTGYNYEDLEDVAEGYLEQLIDRNLIQVASRRTDGRVKTCRIHYLLRDLCINESEEEKFLEVICREDNCLSRNKSRRLSIQVRIDPYLSSIRSHPSRSLLFLGQDTYSFDPNHWKWVLENFKLLRVLNFGRVNLYSIPTRIGELIHLRYLRIESDSLKALPTSIGNLTNLETLDMRGTCLDCLPNGIWKLHRLRNLYMSGPVSLPNDLDPDVETLWSLQVLSTVSLNPQTSIPIVSAKLPSVRKLGIWFGSDESKSEVVRVLKSVCHLLHLQTLKIINYSERALPNSFPLTIKKLTLRQVRLEVGGCMRELGKLYNLMILKLQSCLLSGDLHVVAGSFPLLEVLKLENLRIKELKSEIGAMPCLKHLVIKQCIGLTILPLQLRNSTMLEVL